MKLHKLIRMIHSLRFQLYINDGLLLALRIHPLQLHHDWGQHYMSITDSTRPGYIVSLEIVVVDLWISIYGVNYRNSASTFVSACGDSSCRACCLCYNKPLSTKILGTSNSLNLCIFPSKGCHHQIQHPKPKHTYDSHDHSTGSRTHWCHI